MIVFYVSILFFILIDPSGMFCGRELRVCEAHSRDTLEQTLGLKFLTDFENQKSLTANFFSLELLLTLDKTPITFWEHFFRKKRNFLRDSAAPNVTWLHKAN